MVNDVIETICASSYRPIFDMKRHIGLETNHRMNCIKQLLIIFDLFIYQFILKTIRPSF